MSKKQRDRAAKRRRHDNVATPTVTLSLVESITSPMPKAKKWWMIWA